MVRASTAHLTAGDSGRAHKRTNNPNHPTLLAVARGRLSPRTKKQAPKNLPISTIAIEAACGVAALWQISLAIGVISFNFLFSRQDFLQRATPYAFLFRHLCSLALTCGALRSSLLPSRFVFFVLFVANLRRRRPSPSSTLWSGAASFPGARVPCLGKGPQACSSEPNAP
jgi:hypothetical protein